MGKARGSVVEETNVLLVTIVFCKFNLLLLAVPPSRSAACRSVTAPAGAPGAELYGAAWLSALRRTLGDNQGHGRDLGVDAHNSEKVNQLTINRINSNRNIQKDTKVINFQMT